MKKLAFLLAAACLSGSVLAADAVLFRDDFSTNAGWPASEKPGTTTFTVVDGRLRLANLSNGMSMQTSRDVRVPGPAAYRLEFTTREIAASGDNVFYGVALRAPDGDEVGFTLGSQGYARIYYWRDNAWADIAAMDWVQVPAMKTGAGAVNKVRIERESGAFNFYVNDVFVGRSRIIDIAPSVVTVVANQQVTVDFDDIVLTRTGTDSRLARLTAQAPIPGAPVLAHDDFTRTLKEKLRGNTLKKDDRWMLEDSADTRRLIDYTRELLVFDRKAAEGYSWVWMGNTTDPRVFATYTVSAKVRYTKNGTGCGGVVLLGKEQEGKEYPMLLACVQPSTGNVQLWTYPQDNSEWTSHVDVPTKALHEGMNELRLVFDKGEVLVFINGEYQGNGRPPANWAYYGMGLYVDNGVGMEVDDFDAREL